MKQNCFKSQAGVTLIELIVYMGLLAVFLVSLTSVVAITSETQLDALATAHVDQTAQHLVAYLQYSLDQAESISHPVALGASSTSLELMRDGSVYRYFVDAGNLMEEGPQGSVRLNGVDTRVTSFIVQRRGVEGGTPVITLTLTLESTIVEQSGIEVRQLQQTMGLRP